MPGFIEPCDPTLHERAPTGNEWVYEIKTDGYRAQVHLRDKRVTIYSRSGYDWTDEFAPIAKAASKLKVREAELEEAWMEALELLESMQAELEALS